MARIARVLVPVRYDPKISNRNMAARPRSGCSSPGRRQSGRYPAKRPSPSRAFRDRPFDGQICSMSARASASLPDRVRPRDPIFGAQRQSRSSESLGPGLWIGRFLCEGLWIRPTRRSGLSKVVSPPTSRSTRWPRPVACRVSIWPAPSPPPPASPSAATCADAG